MDTRILIIDDSALIRIILKNILQYAGFINVFEAHGSNFLETIETYNPQLIIIDVNMPNFGGLETIQQIKNSHSNIKIIVCSNISLKAEIEQIYKNEVDSFIIKPFNPIVIIDIIKRILNDA